MQTDQSGAFLPKRVVPFIGKQAPPVVTKGAGAGTRATARRLQLNTSEDEKGSAGSSRPVAAKPIIERSQPRFSAPPPTSPGNPLHLKRGRSSALGEVGPEAGPRSELGESSAKRPIGLHDENEKLAAQSNLRLQESCERIRATGKVARLCELWRSRDGDGKMAGKDFGRLLLELGIQEDTST